MTMQHPSKSALLRRAPRRALGWPAWVAVTGVIAFGAWRTGALDVSAWRAWLRQLQQPLASSVASSSVALGRSDVIDVAYDPTGQLWMSIAVRGQPAPEVAVLSAAGTLRRFGSLREAVAASWSTMRAAGSLPGFWAVSAGGVWAGASRYDGRSWQEPDLSEVTGLSFDAAALVDSADRAWVPFTQELECPMGGPCVNHGLAVVGPTGRIDNAFAWPASQSGGAEGSARWWHMTTAADGPMIAANATLFDLAKGVRELIEPLDPARHPSRSGGQVVAIENEASGALVLWSRVEESDPGSGLTQQRLLRLIRQAGVWQESDWTDLVALPDDPQRVEPITTAATGPDGTVWFGLATGAIIQVLPSTEMYRWHSGNSPIEGVARRILPDADGVWAATAAGLHRYDRRAGWLRRAQAVLPMVMRGATPVDTSSMVYIAAGTFMMGAQGCEPQPLQTSLPPTSPPPSAPCDPDAESDELPLHAVALRAFWIDRTEVTVAAWNARGVDRRDAAYDLPVTNVSWDAARRFCAWQHKQLPTEAQWERAARGPSVRVYPWPENVTGPLLANVAGDADGFAGLAPVGSFPMGASPDGVLDMAGNVWEWVRDWYADGWYAQSPGDNPTGPPTGQERVVRGGSAFDGWSDQRTSNRGWGLVDGPPSLDDRERVGFRCVLEP